MPVITNEYRTTQHIPSQIDFTHLMQSRGNITAQIQHISLLGRPSLLFTSIQRGRLDIAREVISVGVDITCLDQQEQTPLCYLIQQKYHNRQHLSAEEEAFALFLIQSGVNINIPNASGVTPLHFAAFLGQLSTVQLLLGSGADPRALTYPSEAAAGWAPIHFAAQNCQADVFCALLERDTGLMNELIAMGTSELSLVQLIMQEESEESKREVEQMLSLLVDKRATLPPFFFHWCLTKNYNQLAKNLLELDLVPREERDSADEEGNTPLHNSCTLGKAPIAELLIAKGARLDLKNNQGKTPLHLASQKKLLCIVRAILERDLTLVNAIDLNRGTPLHSCFSTMGGQDETMKLLIERGADCGAQNLQGETPLHLAASLGYVDLITLILDRYPDLLNTEGASGAPPLFSACKARSTEPLSLLLAKEAAWDLKNQEGWSLLHQAARYGDRGIVSKVLEVANSLIESRDNEDNTPLHIACKRGDPEVIQTLLNSNANVMKVNQDRQFPIHFLLPTGRIPQMEAFLAQDLNQIQATDVDENTLLHLAPIHLIEFFIERAPALLEQRNNTGSTPLHLLAERQIRNVGLGIQHMLRANPGLRDAVDHAGQTPLQRAEAKNNTAAIKALRRQRRR